MATLQKPKRQLGLLRAGAKISVQLTHLRQLVDTLDQLWQPANNGTLSVVYMSHTKLAQLHANYCDDPTPTDIITFPAEPFTDAAATDFGELCISPQAALEYVKKHGGSFEEEMRRYVIHGYLHLIGYDDLQPRAKQQMRRAEAKSLRACQGIPPIFTKNKKTRPKKN